MPDAPIVTASPGSAPHTAVPLHLQYPGAYACRFGRTLAQIGDPNHLERRMVMAGQLTQKERMMLQDQLKHEELCVRKYGSYANATGNQDVKKMFNEIASDEQTHYDTLNGYLGGTVHLPKTRPNQPAHTGAAAQPGGPPQSTRTMEAGTGAQPSSTMFAGPGAGLLSHEFAQDMGVPAGDEAHALSDMLVTEKFISGAYDTAIFEAADPQLRNSLKQIQDDEQKHGEKIYNYMQQHGMYKPQ